ASRRRHTRSYGDWSSDVCSSDLFRVAITSEYLGVGYIIGSRVAGILFAGGIISWLVIMPAIKFYGQLAGNVPIYPSTIPIPQMRSEERRVGKECSMGR